jgi:hypothetical protein
MCVEWQRKKKRIRIELVLFLYILRQLMLLLNIFSNFIKEAWNSTLLYLLAATKFIKIKLFHRGVEGEGVFEGYVTPYIDDFFNK